MLAAAGSRVTSAPDQDPLPEEARALLAEIGRADIIVGIPSFNTADTVGRVVIAVEAGLRKLFPDAASVICVSDGGSSDGTLEAAMSAGVGGEEERYLVPPGSPVPRKLGFRYRGPSGKGSAVRSIVEAARRLDVSACAVVDADLRSITPYWLDRLLGPVVRHGYGFVAPLYTRHKYDATITNSVAFPLTTALYGLRLRQPIGGDFGFSGDLAEAFAAEDVWDTDVARFGIDVWMTTVAVVRGVKTGQAFLGAKIHDPKDPGQDLGPMFRQVVGCLYDLAGRFSERWWEVDGATAPATLGFPAEFSAAPVEVSVPRLHWKFVEGYVEHRDRWTRVLSEASMEGIERAVAEASESEGTLALHTEAWTRILYDFLVAHRAEVMPARELLDSMIPLYYARTATFIDETRHASPTEAERRIQEGADLAVELKPYLRERWRDAGLPVPRAPELAPERA
jgi:glucosylglycerate synthase